MITLRQLDSLFQGLTLTLKGALEYKILYFIHSPEGHRTTRNLGSHGSVAEDSSLLGCDKCVTLEIPNIQKECNVHILRIKQSKNCLTLSFKT